MIQNKIGKFILADTGFWIGLCDTKDDHSKISKEIFESLKQFWIVLPWPLLYEVLRTRFVKHLSKVNQFQQVLRTADVQKINDMPYREHALEKTIALDHLSKRSISLVDMVLRFMIEDVNLKIDGIITYNHKDFIDSCQRRQIPIISKPSDITTFTSTIL